jgi:hypothetical protein
MSIHGKVTFQEALDIVESLPESQQEELIEIVHQRLAQYRQDLFVSQRRGSIGEVKRNTVEALMKELYCSSPKTWAEKR